MTAPNFDDCDEVVRRLWPHLDGMLPESDRALITRHLERCSECRSHFDFAMAFLEAVASAQPTAAENVELRERVLAALSKEGFTG